MAGGLLPNAEQTFFDLNGQPLAAGQVFTYVPGTTTPKTTWNDQDLTVANTNPVILDQAGRATIWGSSDMYRQVVLDQFGNLVWDRVTQAIPNTINGTFTVNGDSVFNGNVQINGNLGLTGALTNLVVNPAPGQIDALLVNGAAQINGDIAFSGCLRAVPGATTGITTCDSLTIQRTPNALDALIVRGDVEIDGADGASQTFMTGRIVGVSSGDDPGFVMANTTDGRNWGMWAAGNRLNWGLSSGPADGHPQQLLMSLDGGGNLNVSTLFAQNVLPQGAGVGLVGDAALPWASMSAGNFFQESDERLKQNIAELDFSGIDLIKQIKARSYRLRESSDEHWGFLAQDLDRLTQGKLGSDGRISLPGLLSVMWKAVQEIDQRFSAMQDRIEQIGTQVDRATHRLQEQQKLLESHQAQLAVALDQSAEHLTRPHRREPK